MNIYSLYAIFLLFFLQACKPGEIELSLKPAAKNDYIMTFTTGGNIMMTMGAKEFNNEINTAIASKLEVDTLPENKYSFKLTYQDLDADQQVNGKDIRIDSMPAGVCDSAQRMKNFIRGFSFQTIVASNGKTEKIIGADSVLKSLEQSLQVVPEQQRMQIMATMTPFLKNDMAKGLLEQCFYVLPSHKVNVGDSWENETSMHSMFSMDIKSKYTLQDIVDSIAHITVKAEIKPGSPDVMLPVSALAMAAPKGSDRGKDNDGLDFFGTKMKASFEGTEDGELWVNMKTGLVQRSKLNQDLNGKVSISLFDLPMVMKTRLEYQVRPL